MRFAPKLATLALTAAAAFGAFAGTATAAPADPNEIMPMDVGVAFNPLPCASAGPSDGDANAAAVLNPRLGAKMRNHLTAYNMSCARAVVQAVKYRGLNERAATIALATTIVETSNANLDGGDADSVGLFQQRATWGSFAERTNPGTATNMFLDTMERFYPNGSWFTAAIGDVAADVQRPAAQYRYRYGVEANDASIIARWLWNAEGDVSGDGYSDLTAIDAAGHLTVYGNGLLRSDYGGKPYVGSYWQTTNTNWGAGVRSFTTADVSGDRYADLIALTTTGKLEIYGNSSGLGDGSPFVNAYAVYDNWATYQNVAAGDVNNDGWADLAANTSDGKLHIFLNTREAATPFRTVSYVYESGWGADVLDIALGDVTGDSYADLMATRTDGSLTLFGNGLLRPDFGGKPFQGQTWRVNTGWNLVYDITLGKVNTDGHADLMAITTGGDLQIYPNTRGATPFTSAQWVYPNWTGVKQIA
jgi:hypothetical protein